VPNALEQHILVVLLDSKHTGMTLDEIQGHVRKRSGLVARALRQLGQQGRVQNRLQGQPWPGEITPPDAPTCQGPPPRLYRLTTTDNVRV
jgi:hypothetical protein